MCPTGVSGRGFYTELYQKRGLSWAFFRGKWETIERFGGQDEGEGEVAELEPAIDVNQAVESGAIAGQVGRREAQ